MKTIAIPELKKRFSEYLWSMEDGEGFIVIDHSRLVVALVRPRDLLRLEHFAQLIHHLARAPGQYTKLLAGLQSGQVHPAVAAFGL